MDNEGGKVDVRCRFALEKLISPDLYELFSQVPTSQHSKLILVMLERALCYEKQMGTYQPRIVNSPQQTPATQPPTPPQRETRPGAEMQRSQKDHTRGKPNAVADKEPEAAGAIRPISATALAGFGLG